MTLTPRAIEILNKLENSIRNEKLVIRLGIKI